MDPSLTLPAQLFAATEIQPTRPRRARLRRPVLEAVLVAALGRARAVLVQAPAGYGKTALLASQPGGLPEGTALAWVSLDEDDDQRFMACLCAALEPFDLPWRMAPEALAALVGSEGRDGPPGGQGGA